MLAIFIDFMNFEALKVPGEALGGSGETQMLIFIDFHLFSLVFHAFAAAAVWEGVSIFLRST